MPQTATHQQEQQRIPHQGKPPIEIARDVVQETDSREAAWSILTAQCLEEVENPSALLVLVIREGVQKLVRDVDHLARCQISGKGSSVKPRPDDISGLHRPYSTRMGWYQRPLPGGRALGIAKAAELLEAVSLHRHQAHEATVEARFYIGVVRAMDRDKIVSDSLTEERLASIYEDARNVVNDADDASVHEWEV